MRLAQRVQDPILLLEAHRILAALVFWLGELALVQEHTAQALALYDPAQHRSLAVCYGQDPGVMCLTYVAWVQWLLGYPDQAREKSCQALTLARELGHPNSLGIALTLAATLTQFQRAGPMVQEQAEATITLSTEHGFPLWVTWGTILRGWSLAEQGQGEKGLAQIQQGLAAWRAGGNVAFQPYFLALLAEAYEKVGQAGAGLRVLAEALEVVYSHGECVWEAELHRLKGQLLLRQAVADDRQAETCFHQALDIARRQQAKALELRAAMGLSRLWQRQGKADAARALLAPVYDCFTEGFDTADLQEAKALLDALA
jgi:predicted ATPase